MSKSNMLQKNILIIDDEQGYCEILEMIFRHKGYAVSSETNPVHGINAALANPPDLIILDMLMPGLNGWQVIKRLEEHTETAGIPILLISALPSDRLFLAEGAIAFTEKIVNFDVLVTKINRLISQDTPAQRVARSQLREPLTAKQDLSLSVLSDWIQSAWRGSGVNEELVPSLV